MDDIHAFIQQARQKNLDDDAIREALIEKGWSKTAIDLALAGIEAPAPSSEVPRAHEKHSLNPLLAALHHVILWFFTVSSAVTIGATIASLYGSGVDSRALASMIAVTLVTFIPYAILYVIFLRKTYKNHLLVPGKTWSIITICLHSIGAMIAAIVAVVSAITDGDQRVLISALLILALYVMVIVTYSFAAFSEKQTLRKVFLTLYLPLLIVLFGILFSLSLWKIGPAKHDEQLRKNLAETVQSVHAFTRDNRKLPDNASQFAIKPDISYQKVSDKTYKVCANFWSDTYRYEDSYSASGSKISDEYVYDEMFHGKGSGEQCFDIAAYELEDHSGDAFPRY